MYKIINSETVFKGKIIDVNRDEITLPDGKTAIREVVVHKGAVAMVALTPEKEIYLVKQYRHGTKNIILEIPAGCLEENEKPLQAAQRELEEEIGIKANKITKLFELYPSVGYCTEIIHIYLAEDFITTKQNLDIDEFIEIVKIPLAEAVELVKNNTIIDSKTISAILYTQLFI